MTPVRIIYVYTVSGHEHAGAVRVASVPAPKGISPFLPANCELLRKLASDEIRSSMGETKMRFTLYYAALSSWFDETGQHQVQDIQVHRLLTDAGIARLNPKNTAGQRDWFLCPSSIVIGAINHIKNSQAVSGKSKDEKRSRKAPAKRPTHKAADALDWDEAMSLIRSLQEDGRYRDCMLVSTGCFLGLRISEMLSLRWNQLYGTDTLSLKERKTGKERSFRINPAYRRIIDECHELSYIEDESDLVFRNPDDGSRPISRQRADQILKYYKERYGIRSADTFSTHSLRKTFGRRVWLQECEKGRGDQALLLLCDVFGHSNVAITKRYLGIRQEEILSVYDKLTANETTASV